MAKTKIIVAGIGGVGGYFGGLLAKHYHGNEGVEVYFLARGQHLKTIQRDGLKVVKPDGEFIAKPTIATDNPVEIGIVDLIVICTKSYDLETVIEQLRPCVNEQTIILPLLNGVNGKERIRNLLPGNLVLDGCVYIVSRLKGHGVVENSGNIETLYFGGDESDNERLRWFENLFQQANIKARLSDTILTTIWEKFIFLSPTATATCYYDKCIGEILSNIDSYETLMGLIGEVLEVAKAKGIPVSKNSLEQTLAKLKALPFETTSSMQVDFRNKKLHNELETLTEYVIIEGRKHGVPTPIYIRLHAHLNKKTLNEQNSVIE